LIEKREYKQNGKYSIIQYLPIGRGLYEIEKFEIEDFKNEVAGYEFSYEFRRREYRLINKKGPFRNTTRFSYDELIKTKQYKTADLDYYLKVYLPIHNGTIVEKMEIKNFKGSKYDKYDKYGKLL
jgi:hypothetical protein